MEELTDNKLVKVEKDLLTQAQSLLKNGKNLGVVCNERCYWSAEDSTECNLFQEGCTFWSCF